LGLTSGNTVYVDQNAAGQGWFMDPTPQDDNEFSLSSTDGLIAAVGGPEAGKIDLLTVLEHEFGHLLGLDDLDPLKYPNDIMAGALAPGIRRHPSPADVDAVFASKGWLAP